MKVDELIAGLRNADPGGQREVVAFGVDPQGASSVRGVVGALLGERLIPDGDSQPTVIIYLGEVG